jgi:hypothetical protein
VVGAGVRANSVNRPYSWEKLRISLSYRPRRKFSPQPLSRPQSQRRIRQPHQSAQIGSEQTGPIVGAGHATFITDQGPTLWVKTVGTLISPPPNFSPNILGTLASATNDFGTFVWDGYTFANRSLTTGDNYVLYNPV